MCVRVFFLGFIGFIIRLYCLLYIFFVSVFMYQLCVWASLPELNKLDWIGYSLGMQCIALTIDQVYFE